MRIGMLTPEMVEALVRMSIGSISVTPDTLLEVTRAILAVEHRLAQAARPEPRAVAH